MTYRLPTTIGLLLLAIGCEQSTTGPASRPAEPSGKTSIRDQEYVWFEQAPDDTNSAPKGDSNRPLVLRPARVFDGSNLKPHEGWIIIIHNRRIEAAGPSTDVKSPENARIVDLPGQTLLPGLIDAHTHMLLHPYNETPWDEQVLKRAIGTANLPRNQPFATNVESPVSLPFATWKPKAPATPTSACATPSNKRSCRARAC